MGLDFVAFTFGAPTCSKPCYDDYRVRQDSVRCNWLHDSNDFMVHATTIDPHVGAGEDDGFAHYFTTVELRAYADLLSACLLCFTRGMASGGTGGTSDYNEYENDMRWYVTDRVKLAILLGVANWEGQYLCSDEGDRLQRFAATVAKWADNGWCAYWSF